MSLAELIGNTRVKATLASYLRNERVPSSLIFTGSDPFHQLRFALNFAKSLNGGQLFPENTGGAPAVERVHFAGRQPDPHPAHHPVALPDPEVSPSLQG
ncbi:MAG: hypothetical protein NTZ12_01010 [Candidatus Aminicenantes bacterium]|nr:hypothetical protein [Candidatus Aminicenantes bacterium]